MAYLGSTPARAPLSSAQIEDGTIDTADLATNAVTTAKIADANVTAAKVSSDVSQLGKNLIQNGEVSVDQRSGDTRTGLGAAGIQLADRWKYESSGSPTGRFTFSRGTGITRANKSLRFEVTTADAALAADALYQVTQKIEASNLQHLGYGAASPLSLTYQAKIKSDWAGTMTLYIIAPDGSRSYSTPLVVAGDESQETFTFTLPGDASGAFNNDTGVGLDWMITLAGGANFQGGTSGAWAASANNMYAASQSGNFFDTIGNYLEISLMQLEVGSVATDFEHEDIGETIRKCYRYYQRIEGTTSSVAVGQGYCQSSTEFRGRIPLKVKMRATPTGDESGAGAMSVNVPAGRIAATGTSVSGTSVYLGTILLTTAGSLTTGQGGTMEIDTTSDWVEWSAEL